MQGLFKCYAVGRSNEKSKSGKNHYLFINGTKEPNGFFSSFNSIDFWSEEDFDIKPGELYYLVLDVSGDRVFFKAFEGEVPMKVKTNEKEITRV